MMVRVEKVFKESEYRRFQQQTSPLGDSLNDTKSYLKAIGDYPVRNALTIIGIVAILYIGFKLHNKFVSIKAKVLSNLRG